MLFRAEAFLVETLNQPQWLRAAIVMAAAAPVALALGLPFPMGLTQVGSGRALPWAWGLNGAFSVVATPMANLVSRDFGFSWLLFAAVGLYVLAFLVLPAGQRQTRQATEPEPQPESAPDPFPSPQPAMEAAE